MFYFIAFAIICDRSVISCSFSSCWIASLSPLQQPVPPTGINTFLWDLMLCLDIWFESKHRAEAERRSWGFHHFEFSSFSCDKDRWSSWAEPFPSTHTEAVPSELGFDHRVGRFMLLLQKANVGKLSDTGNWSQHFQQLAGCSASLVWVSLNKGAIWVGQERLFKCKSA